MIVDCALPAEAGRTNPQMRNAMSDARITKHELLDLAKAAVADRGLNYGKPEDNFARIALRWKAHIKNRFGVDLPLDAASVAIMCMDLKMARLENTPDHLDSWVDTAGYAACGANIAADALPGQLRDRYKASVSTILNHLGD